MKPTMNSQCGRMNAFARGSLGTATGLWMILSVNSVNAQLPESGASLDSAIKGLQVAQSRIGSAKCTVTIRATNEMVRKDKFGVEVSPQPEVIVQIVANKGKMAFTETLITGNDRVASNLRTSNREIHDGKDGYIQLTYRDRASGRQVMWIPSTVSKWGVKDWMYQVLGKNILDLLRNRKYDAIVPAESATFGPILRVTLDPKRHLDGQPLTTASVDLAPAFGYAIVSMRTDGLTTQEITKFSRHGEIVVPREAKRSSYIHGKPLRMETITFSNYEINKVPDSLFAISMKPGDIVQNEKRRWVIGPNGERVLTWKAEEKLDPKMPLGWLFVGSTTVALMLGFGVLVKRRQAGGVHRFRASRIMSLRKP